MMIARIFLSLVALATAALAADVSVVRLPGGGFKPSAAVDDRGTMHVVYFSGKADRGDAFYVTSRDGGAIFSTPLRVNSQPGSVLGVSGIRGPKLALGANGRAHVLWNGTGIAQPRGPLNPQMPAESPFNGTPLLYSRLGADGRSFEPQRNLMRKTCSLDGGGTIAADGETVVAVWHAATPEQTGETSRAVWLARSTDGGATFAEETNLLPTQTGACACCSVAAGKLADGSFAVIYRSAETTMKRDLRLLVSRDGLKTFTLRTLAEERSGTCPMSSAFVASSSGAWEVQGRIFLGDLAKPESAREISSGSGNKHPSIATNARGETLVAWTVGTGWNRGGAIAWQIFERDGKAATSGRADGLPANGTVAAVTRPDGGFAVIY